MPVNSLWWVPLAAGLEDALNPCVLMTCAAFIMHGVWVKQNAVPLGRVRILFAVVYVLCAWAFNLGFFQKFFFTPGFMFIAKAIYFVLGLLALALGVVSFRDWLSLRRRGQGAGLESKTMSAPAHAALVGPATVVLAVGLSMLATIWPLNYFMLVLGLPGQPWLTTGLFALYTLMALWPLWLLWLCLAMKNISQSLLKIFYAAIFFTASSSMILLFR